MRLKLVSTAAFAACALSLLGAGGASAATEFGDSCSGTAPAAEYTLTTLSKPAGSPSLTAPVAGVITKVSIKNQVPIPFPLPQMVKVLRPAGGNNFTTVAQALVTAQTGTTVAETRLPVQAGDHLGLHGEPSGVIPEGLTIYCSGGGGGSRLGAKMGDLPPGASGEFLDVTEGGVPVVGVIEPDADNDGFGDETQDQCPQSAALQTPCPPITLGAVGQAGRTSAVVLVSVSTETAVKVKAVAKLGKGKKATITAPKKAVAAGKLGRFTLTFPAKLKSKLKELTPKQKLTLKITASATNAIGQVSSDVLKIKLKGQGR